MLIDTGNDSDGYYIANFIKEQNITKINYLILTHIDDHIGGAYKIIQELNIDVIYMPNMDIDKQFYKDFLTEANKYNVKIDKSLIASNEIQYNLGNDKWKVLNIN